MTFITLLTWILIKETEPYFIMSLIPIYSVWIVLCISGNHKLFNNKVTKFLSDISMEVYLIHMVIFRIIEKCQLESFIYDSSILFLVYSLIMLIIVVLVSGIIHYYLLPRIEKTTGNIARMLFE